MSGLFLWSIRLTLYYKTTGLIFTAHGYTTTLEGLPTHDDGECYGEYL